jgi:hypothetical protein
MSAEPFYARRAPRCYRRPNARTSRGVPGRLSWFVSVMRDHLAGR